MSSFIDCDFFIHDMDMEPEVNKTYIGIEEPHGKLGDTVTLENLTDFSKKSNGLIQIYSKRSILSSIRGVKPKNLYVEITETCEYIISERPTSLEQIEAMYDRAIEKANTLLGKRCTVKCWQKTFSNVDIVDIVSRISFDRRNKNIIIKDDQYDKYIIDPYWVVSIEEC